MPKRDRSVAKRWFHALLVVCEAACVGVALLGLLPLLEPRHQRPGIKSSRPWSVIVRASPAESLTIGASGVAAAAALEAARRRIRRVWAADLA
jgi:hypothetical protein